MVWHIGRSRGWGRGAGLGNRIPEVRHGQRNRNAFWMDTARIFGSIQTASCMCNELVHPVLAGRQLESIAGGDGRLVSLSAGSCEAVLCTIFDVGRHVGRIGL